MCLLLPSKAHAVHNAFCACSGQDQDWNASYARTSRLVIAWIQLPIPFCLEPCFSGGKWNTGLTYQKFVSSAKLWGEIGGGGVERGEEKGHDVIIWSTTPPTHPHPHLPVPIHLHMPSLRTGRRIPVLSRFLIRLHDVFTKPHQASRTFAEQLLLDQIYFADTSKLCSFRPAKLCSGTRSDIFDCVWLAGLDVCATVTSRHRTSAQLAMAHFTARHFYHAYLLRTFDTGQITVNKKSADSLYNLYKW